MNEAQIKQRARSIRSIHVEGEPPQVVFQAVTTREAALIFGEEWVAAMREAGHKVRQVRVHYRDPRGVWVTTMYERPRWWWQLLAAFAWSGTVWGSGQVPERRP
jgi:hypothetical protein